MTTHPSQSKPGHLLISAPSGPMLHSVSPMAIPAQHSTECGCSRLLISFPTAPLAHCPAGRSRSHPRLATTGAESVPFAMGHSLEALRHRILPVPTPFPLPAHLQFVACQRPVLAISLLPLISTPSPSPTPADLPVLPSPLIHLASAFPTTP